MLREAVEAIWAPDAPRIIRDYTDHGIDHCVRVAVHALNLLGANARAPLSRNEAYVLLAGIYLHDIGMQCDVVRHPKIRERAEAYGAQFGIDFGAQWASDYSLAEQSAIRRNHSYLSAAWIDSAQNGNGGILGPASSTIPRALVDDLIDVCKHHTAVPIENCPEGFQWDPKARKRLVAALLRLADELDIDANRVEIAVVQEFNLDPANAVYWWLHNRTTIVFPTPYSATVQVRLEPGDFVAYGDVVQSAYIDRFRAKNEGVLDVLGANFIPIRITSDSRVREASRESPFPPEICWALDELARQPQTNRLAQWGAGSGSAAISSRSGWPSDRAAHSGSVQSAPPAPAQHDDVSATIEGQPCHNASANYARWKASHGLPASFPRLNRISSMDLAQRFYVADEERIADIDARIGRRQVVVTVGPGHGCTALHDYVFNLVDRHAEPRRIIPVKIDVSAFLRPEVEPAKSLDLDGQIRRGVLFDLIRPKRRWHQVALKGHYHRLIGFVDKQYLDDHKYLIEVTLRRCTAEPEAWNEIVSLAPAFGADLSELLATIHRDLTVKPAIFIDIPSQTLSHQVDALSMLLKGFFEGDHGHNRTGRVADIFEDLSVVMFMGKPSLSQMQQYVPSLTDVVDFPPYTWSEVCCILDHHYHAESGDLASHPVFGLVDQRFVEKVYNPRKSLDSMMVDLESEILAVLDCDPDAIPFMIEMKRMP